MDITTASISNMVSIFVNHNGYKFFYIQSPVTMVIKYNGMNIALSRGIPHKVTAHDSTNIISNLSQLTTVNIIRTDNEL